MLSQFFSTQRPDRAVLRTASGAAIDLLWICHATALCGSRFTGLAVADLESR